ncbi:MAG: hypothetical protein ACRC8Y_18395 [Chroococcales cyanobacterium]
MEHTDGNYGSEPIKAYHTLSGKRSHKVKPGQTRLSGRPGNLQSAQELG